MSNLKFIWVHPARVKNCLEIAEENLTPHQLQISLGFTEDLTTGFRTYYVPRES